MSDTDKYIGAPFKWGGRDSEGYDCFGLVKAILAEDGIDCIDFQTPIDRSRVMLSIQTSLPFWKETEPRPGAVLLFRIRGGMHVGYMEEGGMFIHTWEHSFGVVRERFSTWKRRLLGAYEYVG